MSFRHGIPPAQIGKQPSKRDYDRILALLDRQVLLPNSVQDSTGVYQSPARGGGPPAKFGKLDEDLDGGAGETAVVSIYRLNDHEDDWEDTGLDQDPTYAPPLLLVGRTLASGTWVIIERFGDGRWYVTNGSCAAAS